METSLFDPLRCVTSSIGVAGCGIIQSLPQLASLYQQGQLTGAGLGLIFIYLDDMSVPAIVAPFMIQTMLGLGNVGNATIGFVAATGDRQWQIHNVWDVMLCTNTSILSLPTILNDYFDTPMAATPPSPTPVCEQLL
jgi:hypothetical protein